MRVAQPWEVSLALEGMRRAEGKLGKEGMDRVIERAVQVGGVLSYLA